MATIVNVANTNLSRNFLREGGQSSLGRFEVNVIFTDMKATSIALRTASGLANQLNACIRIRAAFAVPLRLPLDHPQISIAFEKLLADLVAGLPEDNPEVTGHLYLCRERLAAFSQALVPNSVVVIGGRKRLWPTPESRIAERLESEGHRVILVPSGKKN